MSDNGTVDNWWMYVIMANHKMLYTGITTDIQRRYQEHLAGGAKCAKALRGKSHLELVYQQFIGNKALAHSIERRFKLLARHQRLAVVLNQRSLADCLSLGDSLPPAPTA